MKLLIAEDDPVTRKTLEIRLRQEGYELELFGDGASAWARVEQLDSPKLLILDWMMPGMSGTEICSRVRADPRLATKYILLLTAKAGPDDIIEGLDAGADDYLTKPFKAGELLARVRVGIRVVELQSALSDRVMDLEKALQEIKALKGLLPICSYCKKIRNDQNYWEQIEIYIQEHTDASFSHGICPDCEKKHFPS